MVYSIKIVRCEEITYAYILILYCVAVKTSLNLLTSRSHLIICVYFERRRKRTYLVKDNTYIKKKRDKELYLKRTVFFFIMIQTSNWRFESNLMRMKLLNFELA